ncbi:sugar ABC transporter substrate-binding protein [Phycicoccus sp. Root563]|uniref:sugar ABC transporter substrate-binding protein n=1 Tax=Phycicoccus sp. Root563 TaxID=1736562 RepID=UPI00070343F9|nr:extracellular solute-binding protein [Phycicoccus sp. Root563]KQZ88537.1 sugar ABC transporter substrate-binding protein [Phycicoccus sp. Root563]
MTPYTNRSRRTALAVCLTAGALALGACSGGGGFDSGSSGSPSSQSGPVTLKFMITSNGPADVKLQQDTVKAWETKTGNKVEIVAASDMNQQLSQGFAAGSPPDLFFTDANVFPTYAKAGNMFAYGDKLANKADFYEGLTKTFTYDNKLYCAPKDFSALALIINTDMWKAAGLTDADVPKTWADLEAVSKKLTTGKHVGLVIGDTRDRVGAFMKQAGGWIVNDDQTKVTADSAENLAGLQEVQKLLASKSTAFPKTVDAGWGGEAFGKGSAAMTIEGNWIKGALKADFPNVKYMAAELPAGPAGKGTLSFTQCYGIAAASKNQAAAIDLVNYLSTAEPSLELAKGLGVIPPIKSAEAGYKAAFPDDTAFLAGASYAQGPVTVAGMDPVLKDFDTQLAGLPGADPKKMLERLQKNGEAVLK